MTYQRELWVVRKVEENGAGPPAFSHGSRVHQTPKLEGPRCAGIITWDSGRGPTGSRFPFARGACSGAISSAEGHHAMGALGASRSHENGLVEPSASGGSTRWERRSPVDRRKPCTGAMNHGGPILRPLGSMEPSSASRDASGSTAGPSITSPVTVKREP